WQGWGIIIAASLAAFGISYLVQRFFAPVLEKWIARLTQLRLSNPFLPILLIVLAVAGGLALFGGNAIVQFLPDSLEARISAINLQQHSVLERATFYANAMTMIKDYPVFGAGGGGWAALFESYQTNPYTSRQAHNFFLQHWIETGTAGIVILLVFIVSI